MADPGNADAVARAAMAAIAARDRGGAPPPNERDPRRVTAHLGAYKIEAEFAPGRADAALTIDRDGALVLKAMVEPVWNAGRRADDRIAILEARGEDWFADFLGQAPAPRAKDENAIAKPGRAAKPKAARSQGPSAKAKGAASGSRARPGGSKSKRRGRG